MMWGTKAKGDIDKIKFPYNLQPIDRYLGQAEYDVPPGTPNCLSVNALLKAKSNLGLIIARPPGSCESSLA